MTLFGNDNLVMADSLKQVSNGSPLGVPSMMLPSLECISTAAAKAVMWSFTVDSSYGC